MENPTIYQRLQFGKQTVWDTLVNATRRMAAINGTFVPHADVKTYKPAGYRFTTVAVPTKEWSEVQIDESPLTYNEIPYLLDSLIATATPTGNGTTTPYGRTYEPALEGGQTRQMYTVEHGSADRGRDIGNALVSGLSFTFNREACTVAGTILGRAMDDNQALTGALSPLELIPVAPTQVGIKLAATQAGLTGASLLTRGFAGTLNLSNFSQLLWPLNQSVGPAGHVDVMPEGNGTFLMAVDSTGMGPITNLRAGSTLFMRIQAQGPVLAGITPTAYNALQIDLAMKITGNPTMQDSDGAYVINWNYDLTYDATWAKTLSIVVTNGLAST